MPSVEHHDADRRSLELAIALREIAITVQDWNLDVCMGCEGEERPCRNPECTVGTSWLALERYGNATEPGRLHDVEPDDTEDLLWSTWFERDQETGPPESVDHRMTWMQWHAYGAAFVGRLSIVDVNNLIDRFVRHVIGENALFAQLAQDLVANGCDVYDSDTRFLVWARGVRKKCEGDCCSP